MVAAVLLVAGAIAAPLGAQTQAAAYTPPHADVEAVRQAALNYIDAIYTADPALIERSVHPQLEKVGYYRNREGAWQETPMTYEQLLDVARSWNADGTTLRSDAPRIVEVYDVLNKTASAKVTAQWGIDYMQLVRYDDGWKIRNIVWQEPAR